MDPKFVLSNHVNQKSFLLRYKPIKGSPPKSHEPKSFPFIDLHSVQSIFNRFAASLTAVGDWDLTTFCE